MDENMHVFVHQTLFILSPVSWGGGGEGLVNYFTTKPT